MVPFDESEVLHPAEAAHDIDGALLDLEHFRDVEMLQRERLCVGFLDHINSHLQCLFEKTPQQMYDIQSIESAKAGSGTTTATIAAAAYCVMFKFRTDFEKERGGGGGQGIRGKSGPVFHLHPLNIRRKRFEDNKMSIKLNASYIIKKQRQRSRLNSPDHAIQHLHAQTVANC